MKIRIFLIVILFAFLGKANAQESKTEVSVTDIISVVTDANAKLHKINKDVVPEAGDMQKPLRNAILSANDILISIRQMVYGTTLLNPKAKDMTTEINALSNTVSTIKTDMPLSDMLKAITEVKVKAKKLHGNIKKAQR